MTYKVLEDFNRVSEVSPEIIEKYKNREIVLNIGCSLIAAVIFEKYFK